MPMKYLFENKLTEGIIVKRKSQFTMLVNVDGEEIVCHCPSTERIGELDVKGLACLLSVSNNPKRKTPYTVEAVSADNPDAADKNWIGINQTLSNTLVEFFIRNKCLKEMIPDSEPLHREVTLGQSRLDFLAGNTYIEVKTPLKRLHVTYGDKVITKKVPPMPESDRFIKHIHQLAQSLQEHERAIMLTVHQYVTTNPLGYTKSKHHNEVADAVKYALSKGVEMWELSVKLDNEGADFYSCRDITEDFKERYIL